MLVPWLQLARQLQACARGAGEGVRLTKGASKSGASNWRAFAPSSFDAPRKYPRIAPENTPGLRSTFLSVARVDGHSKRGVVSAGQRLRMHDRSQAAALMTPWTVPTDTPTSLAILRMLSPVGPRVEDRLPDLCGRPWAAPASCLALWPAPEPP